MDWTESDPCPAWCRGRHRPDDYPEDRVHESEGRIVPALVACGRDGSPVEADVSVVVSRRVGATTDYLVIDAGHAPSMAIALPYGPALVEALREVLARVDAATRNAP